MAARGALGLLRQATLTRASGARRGSKNLGWWGRAVAEREAGPVEPPTPFPAEPLHGRARKRAFLELAIGQEELGRMTVELADDIAPKTVDNFLRLCKGEGELAYKGTTLHKVVKGFVVVGGDVEAGDGSGGHSALGSKYFEDENFAGRHSARGVVSMANSGIDSNSSQFLVTGAPLPQLDGRNVAFGVVVDGLDLLDQVEEVFTVNGKPVTDVRITDCGEA